MSGAAVGRRAFLSSVGAAAIAGAGCRARSGGGPLILRLSHSMTAGPTALHVFGQTFKEIVEAKTHGAVIVDWHTNARGLAPDGYHVSAYGVEAYTQLIAAAIERSPG